MPVTTRDFSRTLSTPARTVDYDAPHELRLEWLANIYDLAKEAEERAHLAGNYKKCLTTEAVYVIVNGTLGILDSTRPSCGFLTRASTNLSGANWERFYDVVLRLFKEFKKYSEDTEFVKRTNEVLAAHGSAWCLTNHGTLERVIPQEVQTEVELFFSELNDPRYKGAKDLFALAKTAFDARPRRDRDTGANAFDGLEAVIKTRFPASGKTFGEVLDRQKGRINKEIFSLLQKIEVVRHNHLGHGQTEPFALSGDEVDLVYVSCIMAARLLVRLP